MNCGEERYIQHITEVYVTQGWTPAFWGYNGPGWYFWQEDFANCIGPYETQLDAYRAFLEYVEELEKQ